MKTGIHYLYNKPEIYFTNVPGVNSIFMHIVEAILLYRNTF